METREELMQGLDAARAKIADLLDEIDKNEEIYPTWTIKEILAHLAGWDEAITAALHAHLDNTKPGTPAIRGVDAYNAQSVEERRSLDYRQVAEEWRLNRQVLKDLITSLPQEKWDAPLLLPWGETGDIVGVIKTWISHETDHAEDIRKIMAGEDHHPHG